jgi:hypothetical protein
LLDFVRVIKATPHRGWGSILESFGGIAKFVVLRSLFSGEPNILKFITSVPGIKQKVTSTRFSDTTHVTIEIGKFRSKKLKIKLKNTT